MFNQLCTGNFHACVCLPQASEIQDQPPEQLLADPAGGDDSTDQADQSTHDIPVDEQGQGDAPGEVGLEEGKEATGEEEAMDTGESPVGEMEGHPNQDEQPPQEMMEGDDMKEEEEEKKPELEDLPVTSAQGIAGGLFLELDWESNFIDRCRLH